MKLYIKAASSADDNLAERFSSEPIDFQVHAIFDFIQNSNSGMSIRDDRKHMAYILTSCCDFDEEELIENTSLKDSMTKNYKQLWSKFRDYFDSAAIKKVYREGGVPKTLDKFIEEGFDLNFLLYVYILEFSDYSEINDALDYIESKHDIRPNSWLELDIDYFKRKCNFGAFLKYTYSE